MDLDTAVMTAIVIGLCAAPFVLVTYNKRKEHNRMFGMLKGMALQQNCTITKYTIEADIAIGLDESSKHLFFYKSVEGVETRKHAALSEMASCKAVRNSRFSKSRGEKHEVIDGLSLLLTPRNKQLPEVSFALYSADDSQHLGGQIELLQRWEANVQELLKTIPARSMSKIA